MTDATTDTDALLDTIHEALVSDGVYVDPALTDQFTPEQLATIADDQAAAAQPVYVVAVSLSDGDAFGGSAADLLARLQDRHPEPGIYLASFVRYDRVVLEGRQYDVAQRADGELSEFTLQSYVSASKPDTVGQALSEATTLLNAGPAAIEEAYVEARESRPETGDPGGGGPALDVTGVVVAGLVLAVVGALGWTAVKRIGRRAAAATDDTGKAHVLPPSAMARIRQARDRQLERTARDELLALGEAIDATEIGSRHDRASWQASIDHYDAATRVLERRGGAPGVLDVVGSLVLVRRGRAALAAAEKGRAWTPRPDCYLDPLHGPAAAGAVAVTPDSEGGHRVEAPLCARCRADLKAARRPDILDVEEDGQARHYFDTAAEPWASTGFGALETDLVRALHRSDPAT